MEKTPERWNEIAALIREEKNQALDYLRSRDFDPRAALETRPVGRSFRLWTQRPGLLAAAAALFLAVGLVSFWLLRGGWKSAPTAPAWSGILADSLLYGGGDRFEARIPAAGSLEPVAPYFTAWAKAGLERAAVAAGEPFDPAAPVERADPGEVRQKIGRMIRAGAIERLLASMEKINKEV